MREVAKGKLPSGARFRLLVSEAVDADELRAIGNLLHGGATKFEEEQRATEPQGDKHG